MNLKSWIVALIVASNVEAEIVSNDYWEEHEWTDTALKVEIEDGVVYGTTPGMTQFFHSGWTIEGNPNKA